MVLTLAFLEGVEKVDDLDGVMDLCLMSSLDLMVISSWMN